MMLIFIILYSVYPWNETWLVKNSSVSVITNIFLSKNMREIPFEVMRNISLLKKPVIIHTRTDVPSVYKVFYWTSSFWGKNWNETLTFKNCTFSNCVESKGSTEAEFNSSHAIMFHMRFIHEQLLPKYKFTNQRWIATIHESPANEYLNYTKFNGLFNATWSYRRKSDIWTNYSFSIFVKKSADEITQTPVINYANGKKGKPIAWIVSNCHAVSRREYYIKHLEKHIRVDRIGQCGEIKCPRNNHAECLQMLRKNYKFYLAFENSICDEYSTEKYWNAINSDILPVVMSKFNYSAFAPPMSFIDIKDYNSPQALAEHLLKLDENDSLYNKYFEWKKYYKLANVIPNEKCQICEYLNKAAGTNKVYDRLDLFWNKDTDCQSSENYYANIDRKYWH